MSSINISLKKEAYEFLRSLKSRERSFSDVILEFKDNRSNQDIMKFFGVLKNEDIDWEGKKKRMKRFRESFNRRMAERVK